MHITAQQEQFSVAYCHAVAAAAGFKCDPMAVDNVSVDRIVTGDEDIVPNEPVLGIQLKCALVTSCRETSTDYVYDIPVNNYAQLIKTNLTFKKILVLLRVPTVATSWLDQNHDITQLQHCAYWVSLYGMAPSANSSTVAIHFPKSNIFSPEALTSIMRRLDTGGLP